MHNYIVQPTNGVEWVGHFDTPRYASLTRGYARYTPVGVTDIIITENYIDALGAFDYVDFQFKLSHEL